MDLPHFLKACRPIDIFGVETQENHARLCKHTYKYIIYIRYRFPCLHQYITTSYTSYTILNSVSYLNWHMENSLQT